MGIQEEWIQKEESTRKNEKYKLVKVTGFKDREYILSYGYEPPQSSFERAQKDRDVDRDVDRRKLVKQDMANAERRPEPMRHMNYLEHLQYAVKSGVLRKRGSGKGTFKTYKWKQKVLVLHSAAVGISSVLLYFDSTEDSKTNFPSELIKLNYLSCSVSKIDKGTDGVDETFDIKLVTSERSYKFAAQNQKERYEWIVAIQLAIDATNPSASKSSPLLHRTDPTPPPFFSVTGPGRSPF